MIVDDEPANLLILVEMLRARNYQVSAFPDGAMALKAAAECPPDLMLLDISMPGMDGYEVCRRLKQQEHLADIPVLFISALSNTHDKVAAFDAGGVDYVAKPFQMEEVYQRVRTHLDLRRQRLELKGAYDRLREMESLRDSLVHMMAHDIGSPLRATMGYLELLQMDDNQVLNSEEQKFISNAINGLETAFEMISAMIELSRQESYKMSLNLAQHDLNDLVLRSVERLAPRIGNKRLVFEHLGMSLFAPMDAGVIQRVLENLLDNAIKHTPVSGMISVRTFRDGGQALVQVQDSGPGIPAEYHDLIFEKFGQVKIRKEKIRYSSGLGLAFAKIAIDAHGGRIGLFSDRDKGSTFWFSLPCPD